MNLQQYKIIDRRLARVGTVTSIKRGKFAGCYRVKFPGYKAEVWGSWRDLVCNFDVEVVQS